MESVEALERFVWGRMNRLNKHFYNRKAHWFEKLGSPHCYAGRCGCRAYSAELEEATALLLII